MKKFIIISSILLLTVILISFPYPSYAGVSNPIEQGSVSPVSKKEQSKAAKKQLKEIRKAYSTEMKGMSKAEKKAFIEENLQKSNVNIPRLRLLIIGLVLILVGAIFYIIPGLNLLAYILQSVGGIIILVWLILWLLDYA
jgi:Flp pilus assembly protein TadB